MPSPWRTYPAHGLSTPVIVTIGGLAVSTAARKARKRAGVRVVKPRKQPTRPHGVSKGFGLVSRQELHAALVIRGLL
ncbi:MAG: hypothetical protein P0Y60_14545 [Candidatus Microbacterium colombiense]|nr:MAG: hypothetical protein P0Y60_14545 [Microbacterium sp.]